MEARAPHTQLLQTEKGLFLIVGGEDRDCRSRFGVTSFTHRWSGQWQRRVLRLAPIRTVLTNATMIICIWKDPAAPRRGDHLWRG